MGLRTRRKHEFQRRQHRSSQVRILLVRLAKTTTKAEREKLTEKIRKISPFTPIPEK